MWACGGRGWKHQCILSSVETSLMLIYFPHGVMFMWLIRVLRSIFLITHNSQLARGLLCNQFVSRRQGIESVGTKNKVTWLFWHQGKLWIQQKVIWTFFIALELQLMMTIILHQVTPLNSNINSKETDNNIMRCVNQRALYALVSQTWCRHARGFYRR